MCFIELSTIYLPNPILPSLATKLEEEIIVRSIFGTAALEGNPLTESKVEEIINNPAIVKTKEQAEVEIRNLKTAYDFIKNMRAQSVAVDLHESFIREIHKAVTADIQYPDNTPGAYRNHLVKVGDQEHGGIYTPPKCLDDIQNLMSEFIVWINSKEIKELHPEIRAALSHYHFALIHPFGNGNGRTARLIEAFLLSLSGIKYVPIMLSNFYYRHMDDYFGVFSISERNKDYNVTPFLQFVLKGIVESSNEIKGRITFFIRKFTVKDYYRYLRKEKKITQRQHDLLNMLLESNYSSIVNLDTLFTAPFDMLYGKASERTARRDIEKLLKLNLLIETKDLKEKGYVLNLNALDQS
jgi:Fic family protein